MKRIYKTHRSVKSGHTVTLPTLHRLIRLLVLLPIVGSVFFTSSGSLHAQSSANYAEALQKAIYFYDAQRSGDLPPDNRVEWRGDSALQDGSDAGIDLTGGWYDGGDHVKYGFPMAFATTMLSWSVVEYRDAYVNSGQLDYMLAHLRWATDYFLRAHTAPNELYGQVGRTADDLSWWGAAEVMPMERPAYKIDTSCPGSDLAGETAAALAAASLVFRPTDATYADTLVTHAEQLYTFAETYRDIYSNCIDDAQRTSEGNQLYPSSGDIDELVWGALWLHQATGEAAYLTKAEDYYSAGNLVYRYNWTHSWDDKSYGSHVLLAQLTGEQAYIDAAENWLDYWTVGYNSQQVPYTPGGLAYLNEWGALRYAANTAFLAFVYSDGLSDSVKKDRYHTFATSQINYILGDNPRSSSYMVGFGTNPPQEPHHRTAHGSWNNHRNNPANHRHTLYGALVSGPDSSDAYQDDLIESVYSGVSLVYNAGFTGALARMYDEFGGTPLASFPEAESHDDELYVAAVVNAYGDNYTEIKAMITNRSGWPARQSEKLSFRYFFTLEPGVTPDMLSLVSYYSECGQNSVSGPFLFAGTTYYVEVDCTGTLLAPIGDVEYRREVQFRITSSGAWDPDNDWSYEGVSTLPGTALVKVSNIALYEDGALIFGNEPDGSSIVPPPKPSTSGDLYETDDSCTDARTLLTDGTTQAHTFHQNGDTDWLSFDAIADNVYWIEASVPITSSADVALEVYSACGGAVAETQYNTFNPGIRLEFTASATGPWFLKLANNDPAVAGTDVTYALSVHNRTSTSASNAAEEPIIGGAIIVAGRLKADDPLQDNIYHVTDTAYELFRNKGYTDDQLYYLAPHTDKPNVDAAATANNLRNAITSWAPSQVPPGSDLTIYLMDHGGYDTLYLDGLQNETVSPQQIDGWLDILEGTRPNLKINIVVDACFSGSFIDLPETLRGHNRVVITSAAAQQDALASEHGALFSDHFLASLEQGSNFYNSFLTANAAVQFTAQSWQRTQTPWLDDNGNGEANESHEGQLAQRRGFSFTGTSSATSWPPYIAAIEEPISVTNEQGVIRVQVLDDKSDIQRVWAEIADPAYTPPEVQEEMVQVTLPVVELVAQGGGWYEGAYTNFSQTGTYHIVINALDGEGYEAQPRTLAVDVGSNSDTSDTPGPDLVIESITLTPSNPKPNEPFTIDVVVGNTGSLAVNNGFQTHLYIDPPQQPPDETTTTISNFDWFLGMAPDSDITWSYTNYQFSRAGCDHTIYARVDRDDNVGESNETNNLASISVCVDDEEDIYEPDNSCSLARDIPVDGATQTHIFEKEDDADWVKFTANQGSSLALTAANPASGVRPHIDLYTSCDQLADHPTAQGTGISIQASTEQTYYARVTNTGTAYGASARYELSLTSSSCVQDTFERDDGATDAITVSVGAAPTTHTICPANDADWLQFPATAGTIYVIQTSNLGEAADTNLILFDQDGMTEIARNDDYGYLKSSRIVWTAPASGIYYVRTGHYDSNVSGADTHYDIAVNQGHCIPDSHEVDNGAGEATPLVAEAEAQTHNFCADALRTDVSDQDWVSIKATANATYQLMTTELGANSDTILTLFDQDGTTILASNDDHQPGQSSTLRFQAPASGTYYARITHYNRTVAGLNTDYRLSMTEQLPPKPEPTESPTPVPPGVSSDPAPSTNIRTLILVNRARMAELYDETAVDQMMSKLNQLASHSEVQALIIQVENNTSVATAYDAWTADQASLLDVDAANNVTAAIRNRLLSALESHPDVAYIVVVGNDSVIPHRRVPEGAGLRKNESEYAPNVTDNTPLRAALEANMVLTDDFYADREPSLSRGREIYLPDFGIGRLIEEPDEITASIDAFLSKSSISGKEVLVSGYDFVQDGAQAISRIFKNDAFNTNDSLIGDAWTGATLLEQHSQGGTRFDLHSINGHSTHTTILTPDGADFTAAQVAAGSSDMAGSLIFSVGCHSGVNDVGALDLPQAYAQRQALYVGNTGYGWGGRGVVWSEALMQRFTQHLLHGISSRVGTSLKDAKHVYFRRASGLRSDDEKVLMQAVLYGLPMYEVISSGTFEVDDDLFPSAAITSTSATRVASIASATLSSATITTGHFQYELTQSFDSFGETTTDDGEVYALDNSTQVVDNQPVQPLLFADTATPQTGTLRGLVFAGGRYRDIANFDPVVAQSFNEYVLDRQEPAFDNRGWHPAVPFTVRADSTVSTSADTVVTTLGQYNSDTHTQRLYDQMSFQSYYSDSADNEPATITHVDSVLNDTHTRGNIKIAAEDISGIRRVVIASTNGQGTWSSVDLTFDEDLHKWTGVISATQSTHYFVQVVDGAGNIAVEANKGYFFTFAAPLPLIQSTRSDPETRIYLPMVWK